MRNVVRLVLIFLLITSLAANLFMYQRWRNRRIYMSINGHGVTQQDIYDYLTHDKGPVVKAVLTERILLDDEAKKKNLAPTDAEIMERFNEEREKNWTFSRQIMMQPWLEQEYKDRIRQDIEAGRLLSADIPVSEDQIKEEYEAQAVAFDTPAKAHVEMGLLKNINDLDKIEELMKKSDLQGKPLSPQLIQGNYPTSVFFVGDNNIFTLFQPYGTKQNQTIFDMKPGDVKVLPPDVFAQSGAQKLLVRMLDIVPGKKADLTDKKTHDKIRQIVALKRSVPLQQYLMKLLAAADFKSEDPNDKKYIEQMLAPEHKADQPKQ